MRFTRLLLRAGAVALLATLLAGPVLAQKKDDKAPPPTGIDAATGKILTEAIEALNKDNFTAAKAAISKLKLDTLKLNSKLSPFIKILD